MKRKSDVLLNRLNPKDQSITEYRDAELSSLQVFSKVIKCNKPTKDMKELAKLALQLMKSVNQTRSMLRSNISLDIRLFKDISKNEKEMTAYIKASYPNYLKKKEEPNEVQLTEGSKENVPQQ